METSETSAAQSGQSRRFGLIGQVSVAALAALLIYGLWAWSYEISNGLGVTNMRDIQIWGAYIALFMFLVGASAGGMIVASVATVFHVDKVSHLSRYAIWISLVTISVAGLSILPDLGEPQRAWHMFVYANWSSPMIWDIVIVLAYGFMNVVYLWAHVRPELAARHSWLALGAKPGAAGTRRNARLVMAFAYLAIPFAFALHSITAFIIGTQPSHPYWYSTAMAPLFVSSALSSGIALVIVVVLALDRVRRTRVGVEARRWLGGFLAVSILLNFFVLIAEYITIASARVPGDSAALSQLAFGSYAWIFWSEIGTGIVALALVITPRGRASRWLIVAASSLILVNVALERMQLIVGGLRFPNLGYAPGISLGTPSQLNTIGVPTASSFAQAARYTPSWVEWSIVIGLCALWGLLLLAGIRYLPLGSRTELTSPATPSMPAAAMAPAPSRVRPSIERAVSVTAPIDLVGSRRVGASHGRPR